LATLLANSRSDFLTGVEVVDEELLLLLLMSEVLSRELPSLLQLSPQVLSEEDLEETPLLLEQLPLDLTVRVETTEMERSISMVVETVVDPVVALLLAMRRTIVGTTVAAVVGTGSSVPSTQAF